MNLAAGFGGTAWAALVGVAVLPVYIRYLGVEGWGLVGFCLTLQAWFSVVEAGLSPAMNREMARFRARQRNATSTADLLRSAELLFVALCVLAALLIAAASSLLATRWLRSEMLDPGVVASALRWMALVIGAQWFVSLYRNALLGLQQQVFPHLANAGFASLRAVLAWSALHGIAPTVEVFVLVQLVVTFAEALALRLRLRRELPPQPGRWHLGTLIECRQFATGLSGVAFLAVLLTQGDKLLLSALLPLEQFGFLVLAVTVAGFLGVLTGPVFNLCYPRLSELAAQPALRAQLASEYHMWAQLLAVLIWPASAVLAFFSHDLLEIWTRDAVLATAVAPMLVLWAIGSALNAVMHIPYAAQLAHGWPRLSLRLNAVAVLLLLPLTLWLVPRHGAMAAGWIWIGINIFYVAAGVSLMHQRILRGEARRWYLHAVIAPGAAVFAVAAAFAAFRGSLAQPSQPALLLLVLACFGAALLAALCVTPLARRAALAKLHAQG